MRWSAGRVVKLCKGQGPTIRAELWRRYRAAREKARGHETQARRAGEKRRAARVDAARVLGTHTEAEWTALVAFCGGVCVRCLRGPQRNLWITKDHIVPLMCGGSDDIENVQPLCQICNAQKRDRSSEDMRPAAWREAMP